MLEFYQCNLCGQMVMVVQNGAGTLVCCGQPMTRLAEKHEEEGKEKHLPVVEKTPKGISVKVGSIPHPMTDDHYIMWIVVIGYTFMQVLNLKPGDVPEKEFNIPFDEVKKVGIYCNKHGYWTKK